MQRAVSSAHSPARHPVVVPWRWALLGAAIGLLAAVVLYAPASWLSGALLRASGGQLELVDVSGTVWSGSGQLRLSGGAGSRDSALLPGRIDWRLRPALLGLRLRLMAECCMRLPLEARLTQRWRGPLLELGDGSSQWPAALLAGLGTPWNTVQAEGILQLDTQGVSVEWFDGRLALSGRAELKALSLSSRLSTVKPMGSYRLVLAGGSTPTLELSTLEGSLQLAGSGSWVGSRLRFQGIASAAPENEASLANLLNIIGRRNGARSIITLG